MITLKMIIEATKPTYEEQRRQELDQQARTYEAIRSYLAKSQEIERQRDAHKQFYKASHLFNPITKVCEQCGLTEIHIVFEEIACQLI